MGNLQTDEQLIADQVRVPAALDEVWEAWTTEEGARGFFAPACRINLQPGGAYEMLFDLEAKPGDQGGEGMIVLAVQPKHMLSFTWSAPPHLRTVRGQMTHVVVRMQQTGPQETSIILRHDGWGDSGEWIDAFQYFSRAWSQIVLPRLQYRFEHGPVDWSNPPPFGRDHG